MKLAIATDHNGVEEKVTIIKHLTDLGHEVMDLSQDNYSSDDYPDYAKRVTDAVTQGDAELGILMCGTGIGMSIAANKIKGIRCAKVSNEDDAFYSRSHNNANVIALSYKVDVDTLIKFIDIYLTTPYSNEERHNRRLDKISKLEG